MKKIWVTACMVLFIPALLCLSQKNNQEVNDGFESDELSSIWSVWRFLPGAVEFQSSIVRSGKSAVKITLRPGDQMEEEKGTILERAELSESANLVSLEDSVYEYAFSVFLPADFPIDTTRLVIAQWKQYCETGDCLIDNPVLALRYEGGTFEITLKKDLNKQVMYSSEDEIRNKWLDFQFQIRFSRNDQGFLKAWLNGAEIINYSGITAYSERFGFREPGYFYFKIGLYRDRMNLPMTLYLDDYRKRKLTVDME